ncbi:MAG TPA: hypothetical protein V6C81_28950 [Planktothrix sp.]|jgi:hypothetical protein
MNKSSTVKLVCVVLGLVVVAMAFLLCPQPRHDEGWEIQKSTTLKFPTYSDVGTQGGTDIIVDKVKRR